jgi:DNA-binding NarL/FixJ family response regulator
LTEVFGVAHGSTTWQMMDRQWVTLQGGLGMTRAARRWRPGFEREGLTLSSVEEAVAAMRAGTAAEASRVLRVLIPAAQASDEVAAIAVVQGLRPFLVRMATMYERTGVTVLDDAAGDVLAALQGVLATVDVDSAHLVATIKYRVRGTLARSRYPESHDNLPADWVDNSERKSRWSGVWSSVTGGSVERATVDEVGLIVASAVTQRVLTSEQGRLLLLVSVGHSVASIARQMGCPPRTVMSRVSKATMLAAKVAA